MANSASNSGDVFDVRRIRRFVELMNEHDLNEMDLRQGDMRIRIRRGPEQIAQVIEARPAAAFAAAAPAVAPAAPAAADAAEQHSEEQLAIIRSPTVGTFYASPEPGKPPFVRVGDLVGPDTTVCIVEAMKVFNPIAAECAGRIVAVLAENEQPVEHNQPLFKVDTSG